MFTTNWPYVECLVGFSGVAKGCGGVRVCGCGSAPEDSYEKCIIVKECEIRRIFICLCRLKKVAHVCEPRRQNMSVLTANVGLHALDYHTIPL